MFITLFGIAWFGLARFYPMPSPNLNAAEFAQAVLNRRTPLLAASVLIMCTTVVMLPFSALLVQLVQAIEGRTGMVTLMLGFTLGTNLISNFFTGLFLSAAVFRPERSAESIQMMADLSFLLFMGGIALFVCIWFLLAYAILILDDRNAPVLPRWLGYLSIWSGLLFLPELLVYFFKTGPFAWDGLVGFWIPALVFSMSFLITGFVFPRAVRTHLQ